MEIQKIFSEIDTGEKLYAVLMNEDEYKLYSGEESNINPALVVGGTGTALTLGAIGGSNYKISKASKEKLDKYKNRANEALDKEKERITKAGEGDIKAAQQKTKDSLQKGRQTYKRVLRDTRKGIKSAKQDLNASYDRAAEAVKNGANEVTVGTKMKLPTGQEYVREEKMGYGFQNQSQRNRASELLKNQFSHDANNSVINRETKNTISNLKYNHQQSQKSIVESGKNEIKQINDRAKKEINAASETSRNVINRRKDSLQKAAQKLKRSKGLKIGTVGLVGTGLATAGTLAYKKQKKHE